MDNMQILQCYILVNIFTLIILPEDDTLETNIEQNVLLNEQ